METTDVYSGVQAMPVDYNNALTPWYAEATRTWATPQNWLFNDVDTLVLHFKGAPVDFLQTGPDSITMSAAGADIWDVADEFRYVYKRLDGDGEIIARVDSIENTHVWAKGGVMIRESLDAGARHAMVVVSPSSGVAFQRRLANNDTSIGTTEAGIVAPRWVKLTRSGNELTAQHSADGVTWVDVTHATNPTSDTVVMGGTIYIGLVVTSHTPGVATTAEFSGISTSGGVSGQWQMAEIGTDHPGNSANTLYVAVEDTAGSVSIVTHPDGTDAVLSGQWRQWPIALDEFTGVNLTSVRKMSVGIGDRENPQVDGGGQMLFDDFRITQGVPVDPNAVE
jgi:regulation of enolase protein 1 (concanavalin A-like superfamily)